MAHVRGAWKKAHTGVFAYGQRATPPLRPEKAESEAEKRAVRGGWALSARHDTM